MLSPSSFFTLLPFNYHPIYSSILQVFLIHLPSVFFPRFFLIIFAFFLGFSPIIIWLFLGNHVELSVVLIRFQISLDICFGTV